MKLTLNTFNKKFKYVGEKKDKWTILPTKDGSYEGDCEDYALTVLWILAGCDRDEMFRMVNRGDAYLYHTHVTHEDGQKVSHMMLWAKGKGWIDNNNPKWSAEPHYPKEEQIGPIKFKFRMWWKR